MVLIALITFGFSWLIFMFIYTKIYVKELISQGYKLKSIANGDVGAVTVSVGIQLPEITDLA
jgi:hypothetical protein